MKKTIAVIAAIAALTLSAPAQFISITSTNIGEVLQLAGLAQELQNNQLIHVGVPFTLNGNQTFLITTNSAGLYTITTSGPGGTNSFTPPNNESSFLQTGQTWVSANNPANIDYYGTNEIDCRVGAMYLQNSGQAVAVLSIQKYGLFGYSNFGIGAGVLEGNNSGKQGTAGFYGEADYRKPIGDVAVVGGIVGGYDNWNSAMFGGAKVGLEYRQSAHLGEWIDVVCVGEDTSDNATPFLIGGGISYSF
ncbi:MAG: hypothetical protein KGL39_55055 [Patescibacteria group bacterium]|nr:hypothetical protein [Patescibacteria group bacterium]